MPEQLLAPPATVPEPDDQKQEPGRREALDPTALGPTGCAASRTRSPRGGDDSRVRADRYTGQNGVTGRSARTASRRTTHRARTIPRPGNRPLSAPDGAYPMACTRCRGPPSTGRAGGPPSPVCRLRQLAHRRRWLAGWSGGTAGSVMVRCR